MMLRPVAELSSFGVVQQALRQAKTKRRPQGLPIVDARWHIRVGNQGISSLLQRARDNRWSPGPPLTLKSLQDVAEIRAKLHEASRSVGVKVSYLEVVIHFATQARSNIMKPTVDVNVPREALLISAPERILSENVADMKSSFTWIDSPFQKPAPIALRAPRAIWEPMEAAMADLSPSGLYTLTVPSSVLEVTAVAHFISSAAPKRKSLLYWLQYDGFMALVSFSEKLEPIMLRAVEHQNDLIHPDLHQLVTEAILQSDLVSPGFGIIPCGSVTSTQCVQALSAAYKDKPDPLFDTSSLEALDEGAFAERVRLAKATGATQELKPEHLFWMQPFWNGSTGKDLRVACSGNFYQMSPEKVAMIAPRSVTQAMQAIYWLMIACGLAIAGILLVVGSRYLDVSKKPFWSVDQKSVALQTTVLQGLQKDLAVYQSLENLTLPRSSYAFSALVLNRLVPPDSGIAVDQVHYDLKTVAPAAGLSNTKGAAPDGLSLERIWTISGTATQDGAAQLAQLGNPDYIRGVLTEVANAYGYASFIPTAPDSVKVTVNLSASGQNTGSGATPFELVIHLLLPASDPLAMRGKK